MIETYLCQQVFDSQRSKMQSFISKWGGGGGGGGWDTGGHSLSPPLPHSLSSWTFVPICLSTPALHCVTPIFKSIKSIRNLGYWQAVPKHITLKGGRFLKKLWCCIGGRVQLCRQFSVNNRVENIHWPP